MIDPVALVEMVRRSDAEQLREMGALFLELAERREGNPDWDASMALAIERVKSGGHAASLAKPPRQYVSVPLVRRGGSDPRAHKERTGK